MVRRMKYSQQGIFGVVSESICLVMVTTAMLNDMSNIVHVFGLRKKFGERNSTISPAAEPFAVLPTGYLSIF
jgi:hypothetical protein